MHILLAAAANNGRRFGHHLPAGESDFNKS
jgi:hypothetical protein